MAYASVQDLIDRFGEAEVRMLAPAGSGAPGLDQARLDRALADASAEADTYLAGRYAVPLADVPPVLAANVCILAREILDRQGRAQVIEAAKRVRVWLKDLSKGAATLGGGPDGDAEALPATEGGPAVAAPDRVFDDAGLSGFLQ